MSVRVVWLNGAFGAGKTTAARLLAQAIPGSVIFDPEDVGSVLRSVLQPVAPVRDFQEWSAWRQLTADSLNAISAQLPADGPRVVIVPQTVTVQEYWEQIDSLFAPYVHVVSIALHVDGEEHHRRAAEDREEPGALRWRLAKFGQFESAGWVKDVFRGIDTTTLTPEATVAEVTSILGGG